MAETNIVGALSRSETKEDVAKTNLGPPTNVPVPVPLQGRFEPLPQSIVGSEFSRPCILPVPGSKGFFFLVGSQGVAIVDLQDPLNISICCVQPCNFGAEKAGVSAVASDKFLFATSAKSVFILEWADCGKNTCSITLVGQCLVWVGAADSFADIALDAESNVVYVGGPSGVEALDVSDPAHPISLHKASEEVGSSDAGARIHFLRDFIEHRTYLFLAGPSQLVSFEVVATGEIVKRCALNTLMGTTHGGVGIAVQERLLLVGCPTGLQVFDISNPSNFEELGRYYAALGSTKGGADLCLRGKCLYMAGPSGFEVADATRPSVPRNAASIRSLGLGSSNGQGGVSLWVSPNALGIAPDDISLLAESGEASFSDTVDVHRGRSAILVGPRAIVVVDILDPLSWSRKKGKRSESLVVQTAGVPEKKGCCSIQ